MIAAMAAAVSAVSTLRLGSRPAGLSGNPALVEGVGPLEVLGAGAGACAAGATKATGCANADGDVMTGTGALLTGSALAAYRIGPKCRQPQENEYRPAPHFGIEAQAGRPRKLCRSRDTRSMAQHLTANNSD
jgi:hypothetical protein